MTETLVLGGTGFVGTAIRKHSKAAHEYVFLARPGSTPPEHERSTIEIDLLDRSMLEALTGFDHAIWVAGSGNHGLGLVDPVAELDVQVVALLNFLDHFEGSLTLLSSQAVYAGLAGPTREDVDHVPTSPYGLAKLIAERHAKWALEAGRLRALWIHRLMYTYGAGERSGRLFSRCFHAARLSEPVTVVGGGLSFLNPLPVAFVADVLVHSGAELRAAPSGFLEVTNLNHPDPCTVLDALAVLQTIVEFDYQVVEGEERWPVTFYGDIEQLARWLERWALPYPELRENLGDYQEQFARAKAYG